MLAHGQGDRENSPEGEVHACFDLEKINTSTTSGSFFLCLALKTPFSFVLSTREILMFFLLHVQLHQIYCKFIVIYFLNTEIIGFYYNKLVRYNKSLFFQNTLQEMKKAL